MKKIIIASTAALLMSITPSHADTMDDIGDTIGDLTSDLQYGAGFGFLDLGLNDSALLFYAIAEKEVDVDLGDTTNSVQVRLGTSSNASSSVSTGFSTLTTETSFNYLLSGLFKSNLDLEDGISAYGMLGFSYASIDSSASSPATTALGGLITIPATNISTTTTDSSLSYGFGIDYKIDSDLKVAAEYTAYWSNATAFAVNAYYSF